MNGCRRGSGVLLCLAITIGLFAGPSSAAEVPPRPGDKVDWYVVLPGDTLEGITEKFLGDPLLWPEIHRLNPGLSDPNFLSPGQRLRVIVERNTPAFAKVTKVAKQVDKKPEPKPWTRANVGDDLKERDGVRTYPKSSTRLSFEDGSSLDVTENSLVFLTEVRTTVRTSREQIEIVDGQAELSARSVPVKARDIEIIVGTAKINPTDSRGPLKTRGRRQQSGVSQVMMYEGESRVESGGSTVALPKGMGTSVEDGKAPSPPEKLLPAARPSSPRDGADLAPGGALEWTAVRGAASYTIEICQDAECVRLLTRATDVTGTSWKPDLVARGQLFWRVTPVAASGLDGYPSETARFMVRVRIAGSVFEDRTASGSTIDALWISGVRVDLWRDGGDGAADGRDDRRVAETTTVANGRFVFDGVGSGTYWAVVDSKTVGSPAIVPRVERAVLWAEQTYGPAGSLCAAANATVERGAEGPCFAGRRADRSDDSSTLDGAEHVARVVIVDEAIEDLRFGFGFGAVTSTRDAEGAGRTIQGSLRQAIQNARQLARGIEIRFVPALGFSEGRSWWTIDLAGPLPPFDNPGMSFDGTAMRVTNDRVVSWRPRLPIAAALIVGAIPVRLERVTRPGLEIVAPAGTPIGIDLRAESTLSDVAISGADVNLRASGVAAVSDLILGAHPDGSAADRPGGVGLGVFGVGVVTGRRLLVRDVSGNGIVVDSDVGEARLELDNLEMRACGRVNGEAGIVLRSDGSRIGTSLVDSSGGAGIVIGADDARRAFGNQIEASTILNNDRGVIVRNNAGASVIVTTAIESMGRGAILVAGQPGCEPVANRFSANRYILGAGTPIDLDWSENPLGDGVNTPAASQAATCPSDFSRPNAGILRPVILASEESPYIGGFLLSGWACPGSRLELYLRSTDDSRVTRWDMIATGAAREDGGFTVTMATGTGEDSVALISTDFASNTSELSDVVRPNDLPTEISGVVLERRGENPRPRR